MLDHKLIVITGGTRGLGLAIANALIQEGNTVVVTSRKIEFNNYKLTNFAINYQYLDVTNEKSIQQLFTWLNQQSLNLSILINNAGVGLFQPFMEITLAQWNNIITTNLTGAFLCSQAALPLMLNNGGGRVINLGSIVESVGIEYNSVYAASKSGLKAMSLVMSSEFQTKNITATHIAVGAVFSEIWQQRHGFNPKDMLNIKDVANTIKYIISLPFSVRMDYCEITPLKKIL